MRTTYRSENQRGEGCGHQHRKIAAAELCRREEPDATLAASDDGGQSWRELNRTEQETCRLLWGGCGR